MTVEIGLTRGSLRCDCCGTTVEMDRGSRLDAALTVDLCVAATTLGWSVPRTKNNNDCCSDCRWSDGRWAMGDW